MHSKFINDFETETHVLCYQTEKLKRMKFVNYFHDLFLKQKTVRVIYLNYDIDNKKNPPSKKNWIRNLLSFSSGQMI